MVSNVDTALLLMGLDDDFNPRRLERYLALVHDDAIVPVVVLTKADILRRRPTRWPVPAMLRGRVPPHVEIVTVNAPRRVRGTRFAAISDAGRRW